MLANDFCTIQRNLFLQNQPGIGMIFKSILLIEILCDINLISEAFDLYFLSIKLSLKYKLINSISKYVYICVRLCVYIYVYTDIYRRIYRFVFIYNCVQAYTYK